MSPSPKPLLSCVWIPIAALLLFASSLPGLARAADDCIPLKPREVQLLVAEAEDFLSAGAVGDSLESANRGEEILTCLSDAVVPSDLGDLFLVKGAAYFAQGSKGKTRAEDAFTTAFTVFPEAECDVPGMSGAGKALCEKTRIRIGGLDPVPYKLTGYHSGALVYLDGVRLRPNGQSIAVDVPPGRHYLQVQSQKTFATVVVTASSEVGEYSLAQLLGPPPAEIEGPARGSLRLEGLPTDAKVVVDSRERRDLPVLEQLDPGDHYVKVMSASAGMMGFTVTIEAGQQTVYAVVFDAPGGGGGGGGKLPALIAFGAAGLSALGAGGSFAVAGLNYGRADAAFSDYQGLAEAAAVTAKYEEAASFQSSGNTWQLVGWGLAGAAVVGGGVGAFLLMRGQDGVAQRPVQLLPVAALGGEGPGLALLMSTTF